ncbi:hypothetical protein [Marasmitruncus massiliensis]|uniref:hypothetical protein n=1 Tax=Marasmitruncus massiliensis TaxID=1944642 RepID=UPI000C7E6328|nr:hypothetical protein [Marasmitruncus massiliensis]
MPWWLKNNIRMIQNNIRDVDALIDIDKHIQWIKSLHANVLQIGCGGITSFYPTQQKEFQWLNPYMKGDFIGNVVEKAHANGIRVIVRFDFSKTHESFYVNHYDWYSRALDGSPIRYHDTVATCINGEYQQKLSLKAIEEVIRKYPVDGIFFNMFGYVTQDYSGNYIGICQCENCKKRFAEMYGETLPTKEDPADPVFQKYCEFKKATVYDILEKIRDLARSVNPEIAVSNYISHGVDIVRNESNSAVDRPLPFWIYNSTDNVGIIEGSYEDKVSSNVAINAVDLPYRFMGVSDYLNRIRLYGNMAMGGSLDWCIIGNFEDYPDYENFQGVREIFAFHEKYEEYYGHFDPKTKIMLVSSGERRTWNAEYRGVFRMLKEEHILFTIVENGVLASKICEFDNYDFILLPGVAQVEKCVAEAFKTTTASIIASRYSLSEDSELLMELFGTQLEECVTDVRGTYLKPEPRTDFLDFHERKWVYLDKPYYKMKLNGSQGLLPMVEKARFGPPERCFGHRDTDQSLAAYKNGNIYLPWEIGSLYYHHGYDEFKRIYLDLMRKVKPIPRAFETDAPEMVEMFFAKIDASTYMLQIINMTGYNGITYFAPIPLNFQVRFTQIQPKSVEELTLQKIKPAVYTDRLMVSTSNRELYKSFLIKI